MYYYQKIGVKMTIEAAIIDKRSLILSSDLAMTTEEYKSYIGVKKIFEIKENEPIGMMINGAMEFENIPLETLIGEFKTKINIFESVEKVKDDFIKFLSHNTRHTSFEKYVSVILKSFKEKIMESIAENGFENAINHASKDSIPDFVKNYSNFNEEFNELIPETYDRKKYNLKIWRIFSHELNFEGSGIIIAGFDKNSYYPSLFVFNIYCNDNGKLIFKEIESRINCEEPLIRVYAMNEEAYSFLTGVNEEFKEYIRNFINLTNSDLITNMEDYLKNERIADSKKIINNLKRELNKYSIELEQYITLYKNNMINYTSNCCEYMPRQLLCDLADSLIKLTALKQKLSYDLETVSSENDIAVITKSENFKWAKYTNEIV